VPGPLPRRARRETVPRPNDVPPRGPSCTCVVLPPYIKL
jgi:hypothetical protein